MAATEALSFSAQFGVSAARPHVDVIVGRPISATDSAYLIRMREDNDSLLSYHLKKMADFRALDRRLREDAKVAPAQAPHLSGLKIPELPAQSTFGFRRQLSKIGIGRFENAEHDGVQNYLDDLLEQVPSLAADKSLQWFFSAKPSSEDEELLRTMLQECRNGISLAMLKGNWKQKGFEYPWTIEAGGQVLLAGHHHGTGFDLSESGEGLSLSISRTDGWKVDIERSTPRRLFWCMPGEEDLEWIREEDAPPAKQAVR